jgi:SAM-dependent methyltransferase
MQKNMLNTPEFWEKEWQAVIDRSPLRRRARDSEKVKLKRWNKMAADFAERTGGSQKESERRNVIERLQKQNLLQPGATVLDIGAGPGYWASVIAEIAGHVTALEPSDGMADILEKRIVSEKINNITIDRRTWQSVDLDKDEWHKAFDLVFASMTPGIDGPETLRKMMAASREGCYFSAFSGAGWRDQYAELWQTLFNESIGDQPNEIIYPFNLVYAMGFRPRLEFSYWTRNDEWRVDEAIDKYCLFFESYIEITDTVKALIADHVQGRCANGQYRQTQQVCRGMMSWRMTENIMNSELKVA